MTVLDAGDGSVRLTAQLLVDAKVDVVSDFIVPYQLFSVRRDQLVEGRGTQERLRPDDFAALRRETAEVSRIDEFGKGDVLDALRHSAPP